jgi:hypothetical protein
MGKTTPSGDDWLTCRCAPSIAWLRDDGQTLLVDAEREQFWSIHGVEAAIWDFLALAHPYEKIVRFLSLLMTASTDEAERTFLAVLRDWQRTGIVQVVKEGERGQSGDQRRL